MSKFKNLEIEHKDFIVINDMIFLDEDEFHKYLDTCDAEYTTSNFVPNVDAMIDVWGLDEEELRDSDMSDDAYEAAIDAYDTWVAGLLKTYDIDYRRKRRWSSDFDYILTGTYGNLKKFAEHYDSHIDMSTSGEALYDCAEESNIDIESGDDEYIIGRLSE